MDDLYFAFATARGDHDEMPDHARDRYALAAALKAVEAYLDGRELGYAAAEVRSILGDWYLK